MLPADQGGDPELVYEFELAERLHKTHAELTEQMGVREFVYWRAYDRARERKGVR